MSKRTQDTTRFSSSSDGNYLDPAPSRHAGPSRMRSPYTETSETVQQPQGKAKNRQKDFDHQCEECQEYGPDRFLCNVCEITFCDTCWQAQATHRKNRTTRGIPHEKTNRVISDIIKSTIDNNASDEDQAKLHERDRCTRWFGTKRDDDGTTKFVDYGRYCDIVEESSGADHRSRLTRRRFPGLVSFVGQTGAGKSTLIKMLIEIVGRDAIQNGSNAPDFLTPVVGSIRQDPIPTSGDVHLYADPGTHDKDNFTLYADCEGLDGGSRDPTAVRSSRSTSSREFRPSFDTERSSSPYQSNFNPRYMSEREILWATTLATKNRQYAVGNLFPRLLYTFSDVVVFVLKEHKTIENVIERLISWAAIALEKSSNQPVLPNAIIILNRASNSIDPKLWDVENATRWLMDSVNVKNVMSGNHRFKDWAQFWKERKKNIDSVESLLSSYYSSVKVVMIPEAGRYNLMSEQISKLYSQILLACKSSRESKYDSRMLLSANDLNPYLQFAFDHFSKSLEDPFDFIQASFTQNPIPLDFGGNLLKLAIQIMSLNEGVSGPGIFQKLSALVASCIMLDAARHSKIGMAENLFPEYIKHCDDALEDFCDLNWCCEFIGPNEDRCINVRSGHTSKGHQARSGKVFAVGDYISEFSFESYHQVFRAMVWHKLTECLGEMRASKDLKPGDGEEAAAFQVHKGILQPFYESVGSAQNYRSHSVCLSCLMEPPEHSLPCGHVLCTSCIKSQGSAFGKCMVELKMCPLHEQSGTWEPNWKVYLKPYMAGTRILVLDGGGVRGVVELEILRQLEAELGMKVQNFFDLVVGSNCGGLIALGLVAMSWHNTECSLKLKRFYTEAFKPRQSLGIPAISFLVDAFHKTKYKSSPLADILTQMFDKNQLLFGGSRRDISFPCMSKMGVVAMTANGQPILVSNYNRPVTTAHAYQLHRVERPEFELKIWEVARATTATPTLFKSFVHDASKQVYQDAGPDFECPVDIAETERKLIWPDQEDSEPDILLSLGSSRPALPDSQDSNTAHAKSSDMIKLMRTNSLHVPDNLHTETIWEDFLQRLPPGSDKTRYVRINPILSVRYPKVDDVFAMENGRLEARVRNSDTRCVIKTTANKLLATCFYFEKYRIESLADIGRKCQGKILCRFAPKSDEIKQLGLFLRKTLQDPYFEIRERGLPNSTKKLPLSDYALESMTKKGEFTLGTFSYSLSRSSAVLEILLCLTPGVMHMISGFPRQPGIEEDEQGRPRSRSSTLILTRVRSSRQESRREPWNNSSIFLAAVGASLDADILYSPLPPLETLVRARTMKKVGKIQSTATPGVISYPRPVDRFASFRTTQYPQVFPQSIAYSELADTSTQRSELEDSPRAHPIELPVKEEHPDISSLAELESVSNARSTSRLSQPSSREGEHEGEGRFIEYGTSFEYFDEHEHRLQSQDSDESSNEDEGTHSPPLHALPNGNAPNWDEFYAQHASTAHEI